MSWGGDGVKETMSKVYQIVESEAPEKDRAYAGQKLKKTPLITALNIYSLCLTYHPDKAAAKIFIIKNRRHSRRTQSLLACTSVIAVSSMGISGTIRAVCTLYSQECDHIDFRL